MEKFIKVRPRNTTPEALRKYDRNITTASNALDEARKSGLTDRIPEIQNDIDDLLKERETIFESFIPALLRPEWETLKAERASITRLLTEETTELGQQSLRGQQGRLNTKINRFRQRVERGEAAQEAERVTGISKRSMTATAEAIVQGGGAPETLEEMIARLDNLAATGDEAAVAFNDSLDTARTTFSEPDIVAQIDTQPVIFPKRPLTKARAEDILERTLEAGGSSTNLAGEDMIAKAIAGDIGRYMVGAFPEQKLRLPLQEATADTIREFTTTNLDLLRKRNHFVGTFVDGDELVIDISVAIEDRTSAMRLASAKNQDSIFDAVSREVLETETVATPFMSGRQQVYEELYSRIVQISEAPLLTPVQLDVLRQVATNDVMPTDILNELVDKGFVEPPVRLKSGKRRVKLTDSGEDALRVRAPERDIDSLTADLPPIVRELDTVIETQLATVQDMADDMVRLWDNPPLRTDQEASVGAYLDRIGDYVEKRPAMNSQIKVARKTGMGRAVEEYNRWFINYDNRSTFDFVMQRFMPFWMYESRRWPRLASFAAKRPVLGKQLAMVGGDWDYGYSPLPFGNQFNPMKGTAAGSVRRTLARDFPELHSGYRGRVEQTCCYAIYVGSATGL